MRLTTAEKLFLLLLLAIFGFCCGGSSPAATEEQQHTPLVGTYVGSIHDTPHNWALSLTVTDDGGRDPQVFGTFALDHDGGHLDGEVRGRAKGDVAELAFDIPGYTSFSFVGFYSATELDGYVGGSGFGSDFVGKRR